MELGLLNKKEKNSLTFLLKIGNIYINSIRK